MLKVLAGHHDLQRSDLSACAMGGMPERALQLHWRRCKPPASSGTPSPSARRSARARRAACQNGRCVLLGIERQTITSSAAISACEKGGMPQRTLQLLEGTQAAHLDRTTIPFKGGMPERALQLLDRRRSHDYVKAIVMCSKSSTTERSCRSMVIIRMIMI